MESNIEKFFLKNANKNISSQPIFFDLSKDKQLNNFKKLIDQKKVQFINDNFTEQLKELFQIKNPTLVYRPDFNDYFEKYIINLKRKTPLYKLGKWVYFPWLLTAVHILDEPDYFVVRTARNKNLINAVEQEKFYNSTVGIAGLSVGNSVALSFVLQGGAKRMKLADFDKLTLTNTNRIRVGIDNLGLLKTEMTAREIYLINPYSQIELFSDGLTKGNIEKFFKGLDLIVDEIDDIALKILIRQYAKKYKIPVIMATDNGDNGIIDIERYDINDRIKPFHGKIKVSSEEILKMNKLEIGKLIVNFVKAENVALRMQKSLLEVGKTLVSWPQLGGAALLNGCAVAYCARKILNNQPLINNRAIISLDQFLDPKFNSKDAQRSRRLATIRFKKMMKL